MDVVSGPLVQFLSFYPLLFFLFEFVLFSLFSLFFKIYILFFLSIIVDYDDAFVVVVSVLAVDSIGFAGLYIAFAAAPLFVFFVRLGKI